MFNPVFDCKIRLAAGANFKLDEYLRPIELGVASDLSDDSNANAVSGYETYLQVKNAVWRLLDGELLARCSTGTNDDVNARLLQLYRELQEKEWIEYCWEPFAYVRTVCAEPRINLQRPIVDIKKLKLSRFAFQRKCGTALVIESPASDFIFHCIDWKFPLLFSLLAQQNMAAATDLLPGDAMEKMHAFLEFLLATGIVFEEHEPEQLRIWEFHNLLFHRQQQANHFAKMQNMPAKAGLPDNDPVFTAAKPTPGEHVIPLFKPDTTHLQHAAALEIWQTLEKRRSDRKFNDAHLMSAKELGELLFHAARVKTTSDFHKVAALDESERDRVGDDLRRMRFTSNTHPSADELFELEIYIIVEKCEGIPEAVYHYDPLNHWLSLMNDDPAKYGKLLEIGKDVAAAENLPHVLLMITARFSRMFWRYPAYGYELIQKDVDVLYQNLYLAGTALNLVTCGLGLQAQELFSRTFNIDMNVEAAVRTFVVGSRDDTADDGKNSCQRYLRFSRKSPPW